MANELKPDPCNCRALRQAARHVTQFYDHCLVPIGASKAWAKAQTRFEASFGKKRASDLRAVLRSVTASDLMPAAPDAPEPAA